MHITPSLMVIVKESSKRRLLACLTGAALMGVLGSAHAVSNDIDCDPAAPPPASGAAARQLICEQALLSMGHGRIVADQRRRLLAGTLTDAEIAAFRRQRDACEDAACLDRVFSAWNRTASKAKSR